MICSECSGNGFIQIPSMWESKSPFTEMVEINCPTCEGQGEISDKTVKHCPACGEPIAEDQEWCAEHLSAALVGDHQPKQQ
jgi:DnaJ-class molecular chaperone